MLKQEGTAQLGMAAPAQLVQVVAFQQGAIDRMVCIVTGGTGHDAGCNRVGIGFVAVGPLPLMAAGANLCLFGKHRHLVDRCMHTVATHTTHLISLVHAACPLQPDMLGVAVHADSVLLVDRGTVIVAIPDNRGMACADVSASCMVAAGAMAAFTLQVCKGCVWVAALSMPGTKDNQHALIVMA